MGAITVISRARLPVPYSKLIKRINSVHIVDFNNARALFNKTLGSTYSDIPDTVASRILQVIVEVIIVIYNKNNGGVFEELNYLEESIDMVSEELGYSIHEKSLDNITVTEDMIIMGVEILQNTGLYDELLSISNTEGSILAIGSWDIGNHKLLLHIIEIIKNITTDVDKISLLKVNNKYFYNIAAAENVHKHYYARTHVQEGTVLNKPKLGLTGIDVVVPSNIQNNV